MCEFTDKLLAESNEQAYKYKNLQQYININMDSFCIVGNEDCNEQKLCALIMVVANSNDEIHIGYDNFEEARDALNWFSMRSILTSKEE